MTIGTEVRYTERKPDPSAREVIVDRSRLADDSILDRQTARLLAFLLLFETMFLLGVMVWM